MGLNPEDITWSIHPSAGADIAKARRAFGSDYQENIKSLKKLLCNYFASNQGCTTRGGKAISPVGANSHGGKRLKVKWARPGSGKREGWRMGFVVYCARRYVRLCFLLDHSEDVTTQELPAAFEGRDAPPA